jgi:Tfp pilus assembly PilM family ATPase
LNLATAVRVGLDLDAREIRAVGLSRSARGWRLEGWARVPRAVPGVLLDSKDAERLAAALVRRGMEKASLFVGAPQASLVRGMVDLPPKKSGAPLGQIARLELARAHKQDAGILETSWWEIPSPARGGEGTHAIAVGLPANAADALVTTLEDQGMHVAAIDARGLALRRACDVLVSGREGLIAIADQGWATSTLVLTHRGVVVYERVLEEGRACTVAAELRKKLGLEDAGSIVLKLVGLSQGDPRFESLTLTREARAMLAEFTDRLARELSVSLEYARHRYPSAQATTLLCTGEYAGIPGLTERLAELLGAECRAVTPGMVAQVAEQAQDAANDASLLAAVGLAIPGTEKKA